MCHFLLNLKKTKNNNNNDNNQTINQNQLNQQLHFKLKHKFSNINDNLLQCPQCPDVLCSQQHSISSMFHVFDASQIGQVDKHKRTMTSHSRIYRYGSNSATDTSCAILHSSVKADPTFNSSSKTTYA